MPSPADRVYLQTHEWHKLEADIVTIGVTQFAVDELTDITFLDVKKKSGAIRAGDTFGEIESVKATSDLYCGIDATVVEINHDAIRNPAIINQDPFGRGWLIKVKPNDPSQLKRLMDAAAYDATHK